MITTESDFLTEIDSTFCDMENHQRVQPSIRFLERDTYQGVISEPLSLQKYIYADASPIDQYDPSGHFTFLDLLSTTALQAGMMASSLVAPISGIVALVTQVAGAVFLASLIELEFENTGLMPPSAVTDNLVKWSGAVFFAGATIGGMLNAFSSQPDTLQGSGSTGRTEALSLKEQLAMEEVKSNPGGGDILDGVVMSDAKNGWFAADGWVKMYQDVNGVQIHYIWNKITDAYDDFKFSGGGS